MIDICWFLVLTIICSTGVLVGPAKGRIQIKSLKTSAVFEQTMRDIEEEARKRAEKFEEGELTPSTVTEGEGGTSPSLSDVELPPSAPSPPPLATPSMPLDKEEEDKRTKSHGSSRRKSKDGEPSSKHARWGFTLKL